MRLGRRSSNVEDRRGMGVPLVAGGGIGTVVIVLLALLFGADPREIVTSEPGTPAPQGQVDPNDPGAVFVSQVLADTEDTWNVILPQQAGRQYQEPALVLFDNYFQSA